MRAYFEEDGTLVIRPDKSEQNWVLQKWLQDWDAGAVVMRFEWRNAGEDQHLIVEKPT